MEQEAKADGYAHIDLNHLMLLKHDIQNLNYLPKAPVQSLLTGKHRSRKRGRGLDFEEVRKYVMGDDIRNIDWKVTARTKIPHPKVFTEERERPVFVIVDQSSSLFFGTKKYTKSVINAQFAGLTAWKVLAVGDRVGGIIFNDDEFKYIQPQRNRTTVQGFLKEVANFNQQLGKGNSLQDPQMLNKVLHEAQQSITHDYLVVVLSDFYGFDDQTLKELITLSRHNDVALGRPIDAMEKEFPLQEISLTDGRCQIKLSQDEPKRFTVIHDALRERLEYMQKKLKAYHITLLDLNTEEKASTQLRKLLARR